MEIYTLIVEITRRCNMCCEHCLRGDSQNVDIKDYMIEKFIKSNNITSISNVTFTGGEPFLNLKGINDFLDICEKYNVSIMDFYIATNGKTFSNEVLTTLLRLYTYCDDNEMSCLHISNDQFHTNERQEQEIIDKLSVFKFTKIKDELDYKYVIAEGRGVEVAELNGTIDNARIITTQKVIKDEEELNDGTVYLNANGLVLNKCDLSYKRQKEEYLFDIFDPECSTFDKYFEKFKEENERVIC